MKSKARRNEHCPCGSKLKHKKCCGNPITTKSSSEVIIQSKLQRSGELIRKQQQGLGHPIVSSEINGCRRVDVGGTIYSSKDFKTFHDFLFYYIKEIMDEDWINKEIGKTDNNRHPILEWYEKVCLYQNTIKKEYANVHSAPMIGVVHAYLGLAYNLYLISHNTIKNQSDKKLLERLIKRLKCKELFPGSYYESYVCAVLIKAGFEVEFENEADGSKKHCDFIVMNKSNSNKYTVEVKSIRREGALGARENVAKVSLKKSIRNQLYDALQKPSINPRIIFIDVNLPYENGKWIDEAFDYVKGAENITIKKSPTDAAYVILTNNPHHYHLLESNYALEVVPLGYKILDFGNGIIYRSLRERYHAELNHKPIMDLLESIHCHLEIPSTFSGEIPEFQFSEKTEERLILGCKYIVPDELGAEVIGTLVEILPVIEEKIIYGIYETSDGNKFICTNPMTDDEVLSYDRYGDAIFGEDKVQNPTSKTPYDLFKKLLLTYSETPKTKLLEWMKESPNIDQFKKLEQSELSEIYCEGIALNIFKQSFKE